MTEAAMSNVWGPKGGIGKRHPVTLAELGSWVPGQVWAHDSL